MTTMANEIIKVLEELCEKFGIAVDWTSKNVIPYIQQLCEKYINYEIWTSVGWIVLCTSLFIVSLILAIKITKKANKDKWYNDGIAYAAIFSIICAIVLGIAVLIIVPIQMYDIITCLTFPEKIIVEYVQGLLSSPNGQ
jgi:Mn2+/Fe2+ NRAMP family transporter